MNMKYLTACIRQGIYNGFSGPHFTVNSDRKGYTNPHIIHSSGAMKALRDYFDDMSSYYGVVK